MIERDRLAWLLLVVVVVAVAVALGPPPLPSVPPDTTPVGDALRYLAQILDATIARVTLLGKG